MRASYPSSGAPCDVGLAGRASQKRGTAFPGAKIAGLAGSDQLEGLALRKEGVTDLVADQFGHVILAAPVPPGPFPILTGRSGTKKTGEASQEHDRRPKENNSQQEASHDGEPGVLPDFSDLSLSISARTASMSNPPGFRSWTLVKAVKALS